MCGRDTNGLGAAPKPTVSAGTDALPRDGEVVHRQSPVGGDHTSAQFSDYSVMNRSPVDSPRIEWESRVVTTLPLVHHVVSDVASRLPRFVDREELVSAGMLGLTQAARGFDPSHGVSFQAFARVRIRGAILDELRHRDQLSRGARRRANHVSSVTTRLQAELGRCPSDAEVAANMDVDGAVVQRAREDVARAAALERSARSLGVGDDAAGVPAAEASPMALLLDAELRGYLIDAVAALPERLRTIVIAHFFDEREMRDIAVELGVTASRVSQLCAEAIALLRGGLDAQLEPEKVAELGVTSGRVGRRKAAYYQLVAEASTVAVRLDRRRSVRDAVTALAA
jgi:RNA polymerase sigma factor for flagellar operon FliA